MKQLIIFSLTLLLGVILNAWAGEAACIGSDEHQRVSKTYAELFSKYDLHIVAQDFLDVSADTQDLKEQVDACQKNLGKPDLQNCDALIKQYDAKRIQRDVTIARFNTAIDMQEYMMTLKLRLEQPLCE